MAGNNILKILFCIILMTVLATGCGSDDSVTTPTPDPIDTVPPAVPTSFNAEFNADKGQVVLGWAANTTDVDYAGVRLTRTVGDQTIELLSSPRQIRNYQDTNPFRGLNVYSLIAVDETGNESAVATVSITLQSHRRTHQLNED